MVIQLRLQQESTHKAFCIMSQPTPEVAFPPAPLPNFRAEAPVPGGAEAPHRRVPNRYIKSGLLPDCDYQPDDTLTEEAGMARNPGVLGGYAGSF
jgi:hypothetical protein